MLIDYRGEFYKFIFWAFWIYKVVLTANVVVGLVNIFFLLRMSLSVVILFGGYSIAIAGFFPRLKGNDVFT